MVLPPLYRRSHDRHYGVLQQYLAPSYLLAMYVILCCCYTWSGPPTQVQCMQFYFPYKVGCPLYPFNMNDTPRPCQSISLARSPVKQMSFYDPNSASGLFCHFTTYAIWWSCLGISTPVTPVQCMWIYDLDTVPGSLCPFAIYVFLFLCYTYVAPFRKVCYSIFSATVMLSLRMPI
jgi:hypothetical protein